jgi:glycosyltransferase involved in cell wall biosynthesis
MKSDKVLSVIIPTYNMERYLDHTLSSLLVGKSIGMLEVIVVNDGSTDGSLAIAQGFHSRYPDVFVVIDKPNGHYGSCVNAGLKVATGKYVKVLDADDSFDTNNLKEMLWLLNKIEVDLLITQFVMISPKGECSTPRNLHLPSNRLCDIKEVYKSMAKKGTWMHELTYRRSIFNEIDYHQSEGILYSDIQWGMIPMGRVRTLYYLDKIVYLYLMGRDGQSMDIKVHKEHLADEYICLSNILKAYSKIDFSCLEMRRMLYHKLYRRLCWSYRECMITYKERHAVPLLKFDKDLHCINSELYYRLNKKLISMPLVPVPFIKLWRHNRDGWLLRMALLVYKITH